VTALPAELGDPWPGQDTGGAEALELHIRDCMATGVARNGLLLHLARLPATQARPMHLRLARAALAPLAPLHRARLFHLPEDNLLVLWRGDAGEALAQARRALGDLLVEGSSTIASVADLAELTALPGDGPALLRLLQRGDGARRRAARAPDVPPRDLDRAILQRLEASLAGADVARFVRRRKTWKLTQDPPSLRWEKRTLSVAELAETLEPGLLPQAEPWLFRRLTRTLDGRMLALLTSIQELADAPPFSLSLNAATILGTPFLRFDTMLPARLRGEVVLELLLADMLADPALFLFARNFARARRYRLLLRGLTPLLLTMLRLDRVEMDYLALDWHADLPAGTAAIRAADAARVVLCAADEAAAVAWGRSIGIQLFQGSEADRLGEG
jgi:hypothetical protein